VPIIELVESRFVTCGDAPHERVVVELVRVAIEAAKAHRRFLPRCDAPDMW